MSLSQTKQAMNAIIEVTGHETGTLRLDSKQRSVVVEMLYKNYESGEYLIKSEKANIDEKTRKKYISSQVSDVLKKQPIFNNNESYKPAKTGTRDTAMIAMKTLLEQMKLVGNDVVAEKIEKQIELRQIELDAKKVKKKVLVISDLPECLQQFSS